MSRRIRAFVMRRRRGGLKKAKGSPEGPAPGLPDFPVVRFPRFDSYFMILTTLWPCGAFVTSTAKPSSPGIQISESA